MSKIQGLRVLVKQFLSVAADEIVEAVEKIIAGYEEEMFQSKREISRKRKMLDAPKPDIKLNTITEEAQLNLSVWEEDFLTEQQQEWNSSPRQKNPESLQTERNHKEPLSSSQDRRPEDDTIHGTYTSQCEENDHEMVKVEEDPEPVTSAEQMIIEAEEEVPSPGVSEPENRDDEDRRLSDATEDTDSDSSEANQDGDSDRSEEWRNSGKHHTLTAKTIRMMKKTYSCKTCNKSFSEKRHKCLQEKTLAVTTPAVDDGDGNAEVKDGTAQVTDEQVKQQLRKVCKVCGKEYRSMGFFVNHAKTHTEDLCGICGTRFDSEESLKLHLQTHVDRNVDRKKVCRICGLQSSDMVNHMRSHTGEKPFSCSFCGKSFSVRQNMIRHLRVHTGVKPYPCTNCNKSYSDYSELKRHKCKPDKIPAVTTPAGGDFCDILPF